MAVSFAGAGAFAAAAGASTAPAIPAGGQTDDLLVLLDVAWSSTLDTPTTPATPSGWSSKSSVQGNGVRITWFYRRWASGLSAPTVTGGSGTNQHASQIINLRGVPTSLADPTDVLTAGNTYTTSASGIGPVTGAAAGGDGGIVLVVGVRNNDYTDGAAVAALSGDSLSWTELADRGGESGGEFSWAWDYALIPTARTVTSKTFTISGNSVSAPGIGQMWLIAGGGAAQTVNPDGVGATEQTGAPTLAPGAVTAAPSGVAATEAVGSPAVSPGAVTVAPGGVGTTAAVGAPAVGLVARPAGVPSAEEVGLPTVVVGTVIVPASVPTSEQVGSPTVGRGPIAVQPAGVPAAAEVGAPRVLLSLRPAGVPSTETIGSPTVGRGGVAIAPAGVASSEVVGTPLIGRGAVTVQPVGVASSEVIGAIRIRLQLLPAGVASTEQVGGPTVGRGGVTVRPAGVPSTELVGLPALTITLSLLAAPGRRARLHVDYELVCVARIPQAVGPPLLTKVDAITWRTLAYADVLSQPQTLDARCPITSLTEAVKERLRNPDRMPFELHLLRDGQTVMAGPVRGGRRDGEDLTLTAVGLLGYTQQMFVRSDTASGTWPAGGRFDGVDQFAIAAALIDQWQTADAAAGWTHAHLGIDTSAVGTSGRIRDREYIRDEQHKVAQRIEELGAVLDGFDAEVDPVTRQLLLSYPVRGVDRSSGPSAVVFDEHMVTAPSAGFSVGPDDLASVAFGSATAAGADGVLWSQQVNDELRAQYGAVGVAASHSGITEQATLDERTRASLLARDRTLWVPGGGMRVTPDVALDSYAVGDVVKVHLGGGLGVEGAWRIRRRQVQVSKEGVESVDLEFV